MGLYTCWNGPMPTVAGQAVAATGNTIKTMLQLKPFNTIRIVEWGVSFNGYVSAQPILCELLDTGTVFGTVTAFVDADITKLGSVEDAVASVAGLTLGTSASGYTCTSEGSITAVRMFDAQLVAPTNQYIKQYPLGREPKGIIGNAIRIRVTAPATVGALVYVTFEM